MPVVLQEIQVEVMAPQTDQQVMLQAVAVAVLLTLLITAAVLMAALPVVQVLQVK